MAEYEVGIGAGHAFGECAAAGIAFDPPAVRKARLAETTEILRRLLDGEEVTHAGAYYRLSAVAVLRPVQAHLPTRLDATVAWIREHAAEDLAGRVPGLRATHALVTPFLAIGTKDEIARHLQNCRYRWGISYFVVREVERFAPIIGRLRRSNARDQ